MNRFAIVLTAAAVFGLALINLVLGVNLIMPLEAAQERNAGAPWYLVWVMILLTVGSAVVLGIFLLASMIGKPSRR